MYAVSEENKMHIDIPTNCDEAPDASEPEPPEPTSTPNLIISVDDGIEHVEEGWLLEHTALVLGCLELTNAEIAIRVVNEVTMCELHERHSGDPLPTDVLTFERDRDRQAISADIAICKDVAEQVSGDRDHGLNAELLLYIVHGILHCIGFDDHEAHNHQQMHEEENRILTSIGVGPIWSKRE